VTSPVSPSSGPGDLDALIGELRRQAARRRASPDFPLDAEAEIGVELDRLAPARPRPRLERLASLISGVSAGPALDLSPVTEALRMVSARLEDLEQRVRRLEGGTSPPILSGPASSSQPEGPDLFPWAAVVGGGERPSGRALCAGPGAARWVARLRSAGWDVYGIEPGAGDFDDGEVRRGDVIDHLGGVPAGALATAVVISPHELVPAGDLASLAGELTRAAQAVWVVSEAQWWWNQRLGSAAADLSTRRPISADTWIELMRRSGFNATGRFGADGASYAVEARTASSVSGGDGLAPSVESRPAT
jgi:hypothetical protein